MSTLRRAADVYIIFKGYLETLFSDNQSYKENFLTYTTLINTYKTNLKRQNEKEFRPQLTKVNINL